MTTVVIGIGNEYRHDDGVGPEVVRRLAELDLEDVSLAVTDSELTHLTELWEAADVAVLVDAVRNAPTSPGMIHQLIVDRPMTRRDGATSTHGLGFGEAVDLAVALGRLPQRLVIIAVEGANFSAGVGLSPDVANAVERIADLVVHEASAARSRRSRHVTR